MQSGRDVRVEPASAFFVDNQDRLWLGANLGESHGGLQVIEAGAERAIDVGLPERASHVNGLLQMGPDVLAFGGFSFFGWMTSAFTARVSPKQPAVRLHHGWEAWLGTRPKPPVAPNVPITHIVPILVQRARQEHRKTN